MILEEDEVNSNNEDSHNLFSQDSMQEEDE